MNKIEFELSPEYTNQNIIDAKVIKRKFLPALKEKRPPKSIEEVDLHIDTLTQSNAIGFQSLQYQIELGKDYQSF
jgi:hypothetical protein